MSTVAADRSLTAACLATIDNSYLQVLNLHIKSTHIMSLLSLVVVFSFWLTTTTTKPPEDLPSAYGSVVVVLSAPQKKVTTTRKPIKMDKNLISPEETLKSGSSKSHKRKSWKG